MGYSKSVRAIKRVEPILDQLVAAQGSLEFTSENPAADSYALRDGIKAAMQRAVTPDNRPNEPYYSYSKLAAKYIIRTGPGKIIAELRDAVPQLILKESHSAMVIRDVADEYGIVGAAITHRAPKMYFPDADPEAVDLEAIFNWAQQNEYHLVAGDGVTLTQDNPGAVAWKPTA